MVLDWRTTAATLACAAVATIVFALGPALKATRPGVIEELKEQAGEDRSRRAWLFGGTQPAAGGAGGAVAGAAGDGGAVRPRRHQGRRRDAGIPARPRHGGGGGSQPCGLLARGRRRRPPPGGGPAEGTARRRGGEHGVDGALRPRRRPGSRRTGRGRASRRARRRPRPRRGRGRPHVDWRRLLPLPRDPGASRPRVHRGRSGGPRTPGGWRSSTSRRRGASSRRARARSGSPCRSARATAGSRRRSARSSASSPACARACPIVAPTPHLYVPFSSRIEGLDALPRAAGAGRLGGRPDCRHAAPRTGLARPAAPAAVDLDARGVHEAQPVPVAVPLRRAGVHRVRACRPGADAGGDLGRQRLHGPEAHAGDRHSHRARRHAAPRDLADRPRH